MYEKEIEILNEIRELRGFNISRAKKQEALDAAIALMRAAEPKDKAEEQKHCDIVSGECTCGCCYSHEDAAEVIHRERAAARAEGFKAGYDQAWAEAYPAP